MQLNTPVVHAKKARLKKAHLAVVAAAEQSTRLLREAIQTTDQIGYLVH